VVRVEGAVRSRVIIDYVPRYKIKFKVPVKGPVTRVDTGCI
jgi:hypothetical protein